MTGRRGINTSFDEYETRANGMSILSGFNQLHTPTLEKDKISEISKRWVIIHGFFQVSKLFVNWP